MSREGDTCLLKMSTFLPRQTDHLWAPNCIRIVEYEIAKTTVETNIRSPCSSLLFSSLFPESESSSIAFAELWAWQPA